MITNQQFDDALATWIAFIESSIPKCRDRCGQPVALNNSDAAKAGRCATCQLRRDEDLKYRLREQHACGRNESFAYQQEH